MSKHELDALKLEFSERTRPIVFWTGAGISAPLPSWPRLRDDLIAEGKRIAEGLRPDDQKAFVSELAQIKQMPDMWLQFDRLHRRLGQEPYRRVIKSALGASEKLQVPAAHSRIWELAPAGVVTLNLDLFTARAVEAHPNKPVPIPITPAGFGDALNVFKEKRPFIAYPHGHLDNPSLWTFTKAALDARLGDGHYMEWLTILFRAATVVFVGITADDVAIGSPIERITAGNRIELEGHYWVTSRDDLQAVEWAANHGVRVVRYENKSGNHHELLQLLNGLAVQVRTEDPAKEIPVIPLRIGEPTAEIPAPADLVREGEEVIRQALNARAARILSNPDETTRYAEYQAFIDAYSRPIHRAWYASTATGENDFLGYHLAEEVDGGAFGTVFKGYTSDGEPIAVKILKNDNFRKPGFHRSFRRGANSLRILTERSVPGVIGFVDAAELPPSIIMEWSDGRSLTTLVEQGKLDSWAARVKVGLDLAHVIKTCHGLPERVLHRDLRPANVMIEDTYEEVDQWHVKVLDFDLSWHKGAEDHSIMHSPAFGYLAPEQRVKGEYTTRNALVDSYGLGMTLYFACTGRNPFPDQHLNPNWKQDLFRTLEMRPCSEWKCLPRRFARLIYASTLNDQPARMSMSQIEGELDSLSTALGGGRITLVDVITEELAIRAEHFHGYVWDEPNSTAALTSANGVTLKLETLPGRRVIKFSTAWANSGAQDWNHIDRMIGQAVPKLEQALKQIGSQVNLNKGRREFGITAEFDADAVREDPASFASGLDKAVEQVFAIANF